MMTITAVSTDDLTGLMSRKAFQEAFTSQMEASHESGASFSLALIDIDEFLKVNETYGHLGGDHVLEEVARALKTTAGERAVISRYGGDEFAILFPGLEREQAFLTMERCRQAVEKLQVRDGNGKETITGLTISTGVASYPVDGRAGSELFRKADQALYRGKAAGRNQVRLAYEERMVPKTAHFTQTQLERLAQLAEKQQTGEAELLREALDDLLVKYGVNEIET